MTNDDQFELSEIATIVKHAIENYAGESSVGIATSLIQSNKSPDEILDLAFKLIDAATLVKNYYIAEFEKNRKLANSKMTHFKIVTRKNKKLSDKFDEAMKKLSQEKLECCYDVKLKTVPQLIAVLGEAYMKPFVEYVETAPFITRLK